MLYLGYLLIMTLVAIILDRQKPVWRQRIVDRYTENDPVRCWLEEQEIDYMGVQERNLRIYHFNYDLHTCLVRVEIMLDRTGRRCIMKIALPIVVNAERSTEVSRVLAALNNRCKPLRFRLVQNTGLIYLNADHLNVSQGNDAAILLSIDLLHALSVADVCFPEINRAITGGGTPELAAIRVFGVEDYRLN